MEKRNKIFYIQTYDYDVNIGRGYNEHIALLPDDAWVCINDSDSLYLNPKFGHQINDVINKYGEEYALLGCKTNRLGGLHQLHNNKFSNDLDARNHFYIAKELSDRHYDEVEEATGIAGVLMLFKRSTWEMVGGFKERDIACDTAFNKAIKAAGVGKIGVMKGVYIFHSYRIWQNDHKAAHHDTKHLIR